MRHLSGRGFSLSEILVVVSVILLLVSLLLVGTGETFMIAGRLQCQDRLEKLGQACQMWSNVNDGRELAAIGLSQGHTVVWYKALVPYLSHTESITEAKRALNCPLVARQDESEDALEEWAGGPDILFSYDRYRSWFDFIGIVEDLRAAGWKGSVHLWERHVYNDSGGTDFHPIDGVIDNYGIFTYVDAWWKPFTAAELNAVKEFQESARSIFVSADHHSSFTQVNNQLAQACGWGLWNGANINRGLNYDGTRPDDNDRTLVYAPICDHPIGTGVTNLVGYNSEGRIQLQSDPGNKNPYARLVMTTDLHSGSLPDAVCGTMDDTKLRLVMETPWTKFASPRWYYGGSCKDDHFRYVQNIYNWLLERSGGGARITYGYNNQVGAIDPQTGIPRPRPANASQVIRILDYEESVADHDGIPSADADDPEYYIALRHGGRANVLFVDGRVRALSLDRIKGDGWKLWHAAR